MAQLSNEMVAAEAVKLATQVGALDPQLIATGTEAHVYALDASKVLKIYPETSAVDALATLHEFYTRASTVDFPYSIPRVQEYGSTDAVAYSIEDRLDGHPLATVPGFTHSANAIDSYLRTVIDIKKIKLTPPYERRKLYGADAQPPDWHGYLQAELSKKIDTLRASLPADVVATLGPVDDLIEHFDVPYSGENALIHGDVHPGNVLVDEGGRVTAVIDFGTFTMFGDSLYDAASACAFYSMYEPDQIATRNHVLSRLFDIDSSLNRVKVNAYLLTVALLTSDLYPDDVRVDHSGHFMWASSVLGDAVLWEGIAS